MKLLLRIRGRHLGGGTLCVVACILMYALYTYHADHPSIFYVTSDQSVSLVAWFCASFAALTFFLIGALALLLPFVLWYSSYVLVMNRSWRQEWDRVIALGVGLLSLSCLLAHVSDIHWRGMMLKSGLLGEWCAQVMTHDMILVYVVNSALICASLVVFMRLNVIALCQRVARIVRVLRIDRVAVWCVLAVVNVVMKTVRFFHYCFGALFGSVVERDVELQCDADQLEDAALFEQIVHDEFWKHVDGNVAQENEVAQPRVAPEVSLRTDMPVYHVPHVDLFAQDVDGTNKHALQVELEARSKILENKLARFGIEGVVVRIQQGPVVTCFEYEPKIDTKLSRITTLEDDLALALEATSLRILAPIPGTSVVGFEVANKKRQSVLFAEGVRSASFQTFRGALPLVLGKDTLGRDLVVDLADMPHLLVAGSTGSGKSVALNAMLISLLCRHTPDELRLILIDPKRLEFSMYADIAHLLFPIVTMPKRALQVLQWVVKTMEERYELMAQQGVRSINDYHRSGGERARHTMPYIVVIIDELADLMMTSGKSVEEWIARIAQMARAAGIHMIVATQRPSVDVITGLIKVNFPSRISFRVTSKVDSRTILDEVGAEKLLGFGDMLYIDAKQSTLRRAHGAFVSDAEIKRVVDHIRGQMSSRYLELDYQSMSNPATREEDDEIYHEVLEFLNDLDEISISLLQRRFRIGYNRSARIIEALESRGIVMPSDGGKLRKVVKHN
jgi:DNA segregation ATPase FtsK/SpoIIIE-like protein